MEGLVIIILIVGFIIINNNINSKFKKLENTIDSLYQNIKYLQQKIVSQNNALEKEKEAPFKQEAEISKPIIQPIVEKAKKPESKEIKEKPTPSFVNEASKFSIPIEDKKPERKNVKEPEKVIPKKSWIENFKEKNPDLEKFIGENLINKIGVLILVLGISFFVKFAIDKDWINEPARVGIGVLCGSLIMMIAHKLKKNYASFSSVLVAGAISVFYFTIYIAFHEYQLFSQTIAFGIMVIITAFSTLVSVSYNRQELAILSLIGGFAVPLMLSTGEGNYIVLFTYIAILNIGILAISYFKKWKIATILAFIFTTLLYIGWLVSKIGNSEFSHAGALTFATIFYFIFSITIVLNNLKNKGEFSTIEYIILIANTFFFFGMGMIILRNWDSNFTGLFTLLLAVYNVLYAVVLYKKFGLDKNAIYLLIGLALTFITLTIPIQFNGNQITLFWAAEAVLLLWLSQKSKISSFKLGAIVVQILAIISLIMDWKRYTSSEEFSIVMNPLFIAGFIVSVSLFLTYWLLKKENNIVTKFFTIKIKNYKIIVLVAAILATYFTGVLEIHHQSVQFLENNASALSLPVTYHFVFVAVLLYVSTILKKDSITKGILSVSIASTIVYIVKSYVLPTNEIIENFVIDVDTKYAFYLHYIVLGCLIYFGIQLFKKTNLLFNIKPAQTKWLPWIFAFAIVYILSNEIMVHSLHFLNSVDLTEFSAKFPEANEYQKSNIVNTQINDAKAQIVKIGYPILWGIFSFVFLIIGIKKQWKNLRIIALSLLGLTIVKLFVYDIKNVSETGKIIAFILLGVLILVISFVYQKIKKLVVDETSENNKGDEKV
jgi:uncharacterized membrane protein